MCFRPIPEAATWAALNAGILAELERDLDQRRLADGRTARAALADERARLRALPAHVPEPCRVLSCIANHFGHVRVDRVTYSVPLAMARGRPEHAHAPIPRGTHRKRSSSAD
jgi:hypothetical protein